MAFCLLVTVFGSSIAFAQTPAASSLLQAHVSHLEKDGFKVDVLSATLATFRREGRTYGVLIDESDPSFFRLELRFSAESSTPDMRARRLEAIAAAMNGTKVTKAYLDRNGALVFQIAYHQRSPGDANQSMPRFFDMLDTAYNRYRQAMQ